MKKEEQVSKYYSEAPKEYKKLLLKMRENIFEILSNIPEMSEVYSYRIAVYKYGKKPLFSIAYFKDHCSLITQDKNIATKIPEVASYKVSGTSIHFDNNHPISYALLSQILNLRLSDRKKV